MTDTRILSFAHIDCDSNRYRQPSNILAPKLIRHYWSGIWNLGVSMPGCSADEFLQLFQQLSNEQTGCAAACFPLFLLYPVQQLRRLHILCDSALSLAPARSSMKHVVGLFARTHGVDLAIECCYQRARSTLMRFYLSGWCVLKRQRILLSSLLCHLRSDNI